MTASHAPSYLNESRSLGLINISSSLQRGNPFQLQKNKLKMKV